MMSLCVGHMRGAMSAQTDSGDVTGPTAVIGTIAVRTGSGEVTLGLAEDTAAQQG